MVGDERVGANHDTIVAFRGVAASRSSIHAGTIYGIHGVVVRTLLIPIVLAGCEHGQTPSGDPFDGGDRDGGACGKESLIDGELIDWESTDGSFLGVDGARITLRFDDTVVTTTPPNGRIDLCARPQFPLEFLVGAPGDYLDGTLSIERDAVFGGRALSLRTFTATRATTFFNERGLIFDPNKAHIVVLMTGDRTSLTLNLAHDTTQAGNDDGGGAVVTWTDGDSGRYVLFPNVDPVGAVATISGDLASGPHNVPVAAGKLSLVAISFVLVGP